MQDAAPVKNDGSHATACKKKGGGGGIFMGKLAFSRLRRFNVAFVLEPEVQVGTGTGTSGFPYKTGMHTNNGIRPRGKYRFRKHPAHSRTLQENTVLYCSVFRDFLKHFSIL